ncbi:MAG: hypothetical protein WCK08_03545 [Betaproteobacteria bacterium]
MKIAASIMSVRSPQDTAARQQLTELAGKLIDAKTGKIQSGYLKLTNSGTLNAGFFYTSGSYSKAAGSVKEMLMQAYGDRMNPDQKGALDKALAQYLGKTGEALGTKSFVKLVKKLERLVPDDSAQSAKFDDLGTIESRLDLSGLDLPGPDLSNPEAAGPDLSNPEAAGPGLSNPEPAGPELQAPSPRSAQEQAPAPAATQGPPSDSPPILKPEAQEVPPQEVPPQEVPPQEALAQETKAPEAEAQEIKPQAPVEAQASAATKRAAPREKINDYIVKIRASNNSPISDAALKQFQSLAFALSQTESGDKLKWNLKFLLFGHLMFPKTSELNQASEVQGPQAPRTFAMGDADGSMGRMVLHAIASGVAELPEANMPALARLMLAEVHALRQGDAGMEDFQSDEQVSKDLDEVAEALISQPQPQGGKPACIFLGDILSDRFTNNQEAMSTFIYKLSGLDPKNPDPAQRIDTGVRFIAGNHDTMPLLKSDDSKIFDRSSEGDYQWGAYAHKKIKAAQYKDLLKNCFKAADYSAGVLTTHNGVVKGQGDDEYLIGLSAPGRRNRPKVTATGTRVSDCSSVIAESPEQLAEAMNTAFFDRIEAGGPTNLISTDFRPEDVDMTPEALGFTHIAGFRQLHGHNDNANEDYEGVTNLNAREKDRYMPMATVIEYAQPDMLRV